MYSCFHFLYRIDMKMSDTQGGYKLDEAQAILSEMKALKKAITSGEKEKQDLILVLKKDDLIVFHGTVVITWNFWGFKYFVFQIHYWDFY